MLVFKAHKEYRLPASLHISIHAGHWHVSFNYDDGIPEPTDKDTIDWLMQFSETEFMQANSRTGSWRYVAAGRK